MKFQQHLTGQVSRASTDIPRCSPAALLALLHRGRLLPASLGQLQCLWGLWGKPQGQKLMKGRPCVFAALACPALWSAQWDHRSSCLPHPWPPSCPSTEEACRCNIERSIIIIKYFPPLAKHRPYHQDPKHPAPVPAPAAEVHTRFQLCRILSRAYQDRERQGKWVMHTLCSFTCWDSPGQAFLPPILPAPHPFGCQMRMVREAPPASASLLRWCFAC